MSNIMHFLAAAKGFICAFDCELFHCDNLLECNAETFFSVVRTIIAIVKVVGDEGTLLEQMGKKTIRGSGLASAKILH